MGAGDSFARLRKAYDKRVRPLFDPIRGGDYLVNKPMSAEMLVRCLGGEMFAHPASIVEAIEQDSEVLALVRRYGKGLATYEEVREAVSAIC